MYTNSDRTAESVNYQMLRKAIMNSTIVRLSAFLNTNNAKNKPYCTQFDYINRIKKTTKKPTHLKCKNKLFSQVAIKHFALIKFH